MASKSVLGLVFALPSVACLVDVTPVVYVAPSAHYMAPELIEAVESLNAILGEPLFELRAASRESRVRGAIVVRHAGYLPCTDGKCFVGLCTRTEQGAVIQLLDRATPLHAAHELLHAVGLHHSSDPANLMAPRPYTWNLTQAQVRRALR
jgi:hypothetical protein